MRDRSVVVLIGTVALALSSACGGGSESPSGPAVSIPGLAGTAEFTVSSGGVTTDTRWQVECTPLGPAQGVPCPISGPTAAFVVQGGAPDWARSTGPRPANWIYLSPSASITASGGALGSFDYIFRTTIDLTGFDPTTVELTADWTGDDTVVGWRVNGGTVRDGTQEDTPWRSLRRMRIPASIASFRAGANILEIRVIGNGLTDGLIVSNLSGTGVRTP